MKIRDAIEAKNHKDAIEFIEDLIKEKKEINESVVLHLHELLFQGTGKNPGRYRNSNVKIVGAVFRPPDFTEVRPKTLELLKWLSENPDKLDPIDIAAIFHHKFVFIHPFTDGNGRIARLLMNHILMKHGFPFIAEVTFNDREKYLGLLSDADLGFKQDFINFIARAVEQAIDNNRIARMKDKSAILSLAEASKLVSYSQDYLSLLARKGAIGAFKQGRNWYITKDDLERYVKSIEMKREKARINKQTESNNNKRHV